MAVTYYCPSCWSEIGAASVCPHCGADVHDFEGEDYVAKLVRALGHPEPTVPIRAAAILGELRVRAAVEPLLKIAESTTDPYIQEAAVEALGRIGDPRALSCLDRLSREGAVRVRAVARQAIKALEDRSNATQG